MADEIFTTIFNPLNKSNLRLWGGFSLIQFRRWTAGFGDWSVCTAGLFNDWKGCEQEPESEWLRILVPAETDRAVFQRFRFQGPGPGYGGRLDQ